MSDYKVGYKKPPKDGQIKKGERRNPYGRRGTKPKSPPPNNSPKAIVERIESELVEFQGRMITKLEARIRVLHTLALKGDPRATKLFEDFRKQAGVGKAGGGVLVVPGMFDEATWSVMAEKHQAKYREPIDPDDF